MKTISEHIDNLRVRKTKELQNLLGMPRQDGREFKRLVVGILQRIKSECLVPYFKLNSRNEEAFTTALLVTVMQAERFGSTLPSAPYFFKHFQTLILK